MTFLPKHKETLKRILGAVPLVISIAVVIVLVRNQKAPEKRKLEEVSQKVRTLQVQAMDVIPRAIGYGYVEPAQAWEAVPEVSGKIVELNPNFKKGNFVGQGEVLVKIDATDYRLAVNQMAANIENIEAQLAELNQREENYETSLVIQRTLLELKQKELARNQLAMKTQSISSSALDQALMTYQSQLALVQDVENSIHLVPTSRRALEADLAYSRAKLEDANVDLKRTEIIVPFNCRMTQTSAEVGQYVQQGQSIARADGTSRVEITAQIPMKMMSKLFAGVEGPPLNATAGHLDSVKMDILKERFGLKVKVRLVNADRLIVWDADFTRTDATLDAQTRTVGVIVAIDDPYDRIIFGKRPPLVRNMFCEVEISGHPIDRRIVIPRSALHDDHVYLVNSENRLERRAVTVEFTQSDFSVIRHSLMAGEQVVLSDVMPAIEGLLLSAVEDKDVHDRLAAQAAGLTDIR